MQLFTTAPEQFYPTITARLTYMEMSILKKIESYICVQGQTPSQATGNRDVTRTQEAYEVLGSGNGEHYGMMNTAKSRNTTAGNGNTAEDVDIKPLI